MRLAVVCGLALLAFPAEAQVPDGGPGGACLSDRDCGFCGWVCSRAPGRAEDGGEISSPICIPAMEGDPGICGSDTDCLCPGQHCNGSHCTPPANPQCACNGDCPDGQVCDQLLFTCHAQSTDSCGVDYHGLDYGAQSTGPACGCNSICTGDSQQAICQPQEGWFPPECSNDIDCGACYQGWVCVLGSGPVPGLGACQNLRDAGWCVGPRDVSPSTSGGGATGSSSTGGGAASSGGSTSSTGAAGIGTSGGSESCGCGSRQTGSLESLGFILGCCFLGRRRRRRA